MNTLNRWLARLATAGVTALLSVGASASAYDSLYVFGDSLSDPGNAAALTPLGGGSSFFPPSPSVYAGPFSNGPVAAEYLAQMIGAPTVRGWPDAAGGTNFAVGGAMTGATNYNHLVDSPAGLATHPAFAAIGGTGISQQVARFDNSTLRADSSLFLLWGGPNDFFLGFAQAQAGAPVDFAAVTTRAITNLAANIGSLAAAGARHILVPNMPDLGTTPFAQSLGSSFAANASALTDAFNAGLSSAIAQTEAALAPLGVEIYEFDVASFLDGVIAAPPPGLTDVRTPCLVAGTPGCAGLLFFDDLHPTTLGHQLLAQQFAQAAGIPAPVPEPGTWALMLGGLALLGLQWRHRQARALPPPA